MHLEIITPDKTIFEGEADLAQFPGLDGSFEVLNHHTAMIAGLAPGKIKVVDSSKKEIFYEVQGGVVEVQANKVLVLAQ